MGVHLLHEVDAGVNEHQAYVHCFAIFSLRHSGHLIPCPRASEASLILMHCSGLFASGSVLESLDGSTKTEAI